MDDGIGFSRLLQHLQRVFYHHGLHVLVPGQSQRMAEGKLHRHCPRDTVLLCPRRHHGHQDGAQAPLFKHPRQNQHVLTAAGSSWSE